MRKDAIPLQKTEIAILWHPTKNVNLTPNDVASKSKINVWWKCLNYPNHDHEMNIDIKAKHKSCPYCSGRRVLSGFNSLADTHPEYVKLWHPIKNKNITPEIVSYGMRDEIWWICEKDIRHEYMMPLYRKIGQETGCSLCAGKKIICGINSLVDTHPHIAKQWHSTKNGENKPKYFGSGSHFVAWWQCEKHPKIDYEQRIDAKVNNIDGACRICEGRVVINGYNSFFDTHPELAQQWHHIKNENRRPQNYSAGSAVKIWWICNKKPEHEWKATIGSRTYIERPNGCPYCSKSITKPQVDIFDYLNMLYHYDIILNNTKTIKPKHLDIYIPELKLAFEYDGEYYHYSDWAIEKGSLERMKVKNQICKSNGIKLIRIREKNWKKNKEIELQKIVNYIDERANNV